VSADREKPEPGVYRSGIEGKVRARTEAMRLVSETWESPSAQKRKGSAAAHEIAFPAEHQDLVQRIWYHDREFHAGFGDT
jgi:hypothetical protein